MGTWSRKPVPYEISLIKPTLGHFHPFTHNFESQLAPGLQANFFWGTFGVLLQINARLEVPLSNDTLLTVQQLTARDSQALSKTPRMLKSLSYKAEAFKQYYYASSQDNLDQVKEVCFDIQVQLVEFFMTAVKSMRG